MRSRSSIPIGAALLAACLAGADEHPMPEAPDQVRPLLIGSEAAGGVWPDASGEPFDLGEALKAGPAVVVFYRAHW